MNLLSWNLKFFLSGISAPWSAFVLSIVVRRLIVGGREREKGREREREGERGREREREREGWKDHDVYL